MSLVADLRTYLLTCPHLVDGAGFLTDTVGNTPTQYGVMPLPANPVVEFYVDGTSLRQYVFALQSMEYIVDDAARVEALEFYELFAEWIEGQNNDGVLPTLDAGKTAESIETLQSGFLFQDGDSGAGLYQIQCRLTYTQNAI